MTTNALQSVQANLPMGDLTKEQLDLVKRTIAKGATNDELQLFLYRCKSLGLDPLKPGQIYFIKYGSGPGTIVVGIEGFRAKAARTGMLSGIERGITKNDKGDCISAWAKVYRKGWDKPASEEVEMSEYNTGKSNWRTMPATMLKKVAEASALRMAFPDDLGGVYVREEMDQADRGQVYPEQPEAQDGIQTETGYKIPFGKFAKRSLEEVGPQELASYVNYLESNTQKTGKPLSAMAEDFITRASDYIAGLENGPIETQREEGRQALSRAEPDPNLEEAPF